MKSLSECLPVTHPLCSWRVLESPTLPRQRPALTALWLRKRENERAGAQLQVLPLILQWLAGSELSPEDKRSLNRDETGSTNNQKDHLPAYK